jgi:hypothetical protein
VASGKLGSTAAGVDTVTQAPSDERQRTGPRKDDAVAR